MIKEVEKVPSYLKKSSFRKVEILRNRQIEHVKPRCIYAIPSHVSERSGTGYEVTRGRTDQLQTLAMFGIQKRQILE